MYPTPPPPPPYSSMPPSYPNTGYYPAQPPLQPPYGPPHGPAEPRRTSPVLWVLAAMGLMALLGGLLGTCGVVAGLMALGASSNDTSGVILGAQVPDKTVDALIEKKLLGPNEKLLAYHDATVALDMSEVTFITTTRVVHAKDKTVATMDFRDVTKITARSEGIIGDVMEIAGEDGRTMRIEIAPLNGGESYVNVLEDAWRKHHPEAKVLRVKR